MRVCVCSVFQPLFSPVVVVPPATASDTCVIGSDRDRSESPRRGIAARTRSPGLHPAGLSRHNYVKQTDFNFKSSNFFKTVSPNHPAFFQPHPRRSHKHLCRPGVLLKAVACPVPWAHMDPHAACRMPHAACRMPHAVCRMPYAACGLQRLDFRY